MAVHHKLGREQCFYWAIKRVDGMIWLFSFGQIKRILLSSAKQEELLRFRAKTDIGWRFGTIMHEQCVEKKDKGD